MEPNVLKRNIIRGDQAESSGLLNQIPLPKAPPGVPVPYILSNRLAQEEFIRAVKFRPTRKLMHPAEDMLEEYALGRLPTSEKAKVKKHLLPCVRCRPQVELIHHY
jgi:hypothetical protein